MIPCQAIDFKTRSLCDRDASATRPLCPEHQLRRLPGERQCKGKQIKNRTLDCPNKARDGSDYCMPQHDPTRKYVDPALFRKPFLRSSTPMVKVIRSQRNEDAYLGGPLPRGSYSDGRNYNLDHVVECQVVAAIVSKLNFKLPTDEKKTIAVLHGITNDPTNLRLTAMWANMVKEVAIKEFLGDWQTRQANYILSLAEHLGKATWVDKQINTEFRFDKAQVRRLCGIMATMMKWLLGQIQSKSGGFPSTKIYRAVVEAATSIHNAMKLPLPDSRKTRTVKEKKAEEKAKAKRRVRKDREEEDDNDTTSNSDNDSGSSSDSDGSPPSSSKRPTKSKAKESTDKPKKATKARAKEKKAEEKAKAKRRVRQDRDVEDSCLRKPSSMTYATDDTEEKHASPKADGVIEARATRSNSTKERTTKKSASVDRSIAAATR